MEYMVYFLIAIAALFLLVKVFAWPLKILVRLIANGVLGIILLLLYNLIAGMIIGQSATLGINAISALVAGFLGIPGVIFLLIFKFLL